MFLGQDQPNQVHTLKIIFSAFFMWLLSGCKYDKAVQGAAGREPALKIGSLAVTQYIVRKNYMRYVNDVEKAGHRDPSPSDIAKWHQQFVAREIVIAELIELGYCSRPEISREVERMTRHMLTMSEGPFYQNIYKARKPISNELLHELYAKTFTLISCRVVKIASDEKAHELLGDDFKECTIEEQTRRLNACKDSEGVENAEGWMAWPFGQLNEASSAIEKARTGIWTRSSSNRSDVYFVFVKEKTSMPEGDFIADSENFRRFVDRLNDEQEWRDRRAQLVLDSGFHFQFATAALVIERTRASDAIEQTFPIESLGILAGKELFTFRLNGHLKSVTVGELGEKFNQRFMRKLPRTSDELCRAAEDMAADEYDIVAATNQGIDKTPRFKEERDAYGYEVALELYEREKLLKEFEVQSSAVAAYYELHKSEFIAPLKVTVRICEFETPLEASIWKRDGASKTDNGVQDAIVQSRAALQSSLGDDDYAALQSFENQESYRQSVDSLTNGMRSKNVEVSPELQENILVAYADAVSESAKINSVSGNDGANRDPAESKKEQDNNFNRLLLEKESPLMSREQLEALMQTAFEQ